MADFFDSTSVGGAALAAMCVSTATVHTLMLKGLCSRDEVNTLFESALSSLEWLDQADQPQVKMARALVDAQAQLILTGRQPKQSF